MSHLIFNTLIEKLNPVWWNTISYLYSFFSLPVIGSPIQFTSNNNLFLKEYNTFTMPDKVRREFLNFCYPLELPNRLEEIEYDRYYWPDASTFIVWEDMKNILGCSQYIVKRGDKRLPIENSTVISGFKGTGEPFEIKNDVGNCPTSEIYRLRRSFNIGMRQTTVVVNMLFKALWAKIVQSGTEHSYITCCYESKELRNLYLKRLFYQDPNITVHFGDSQKKWSVLRKDCLLHERQFAAQSRRHFYLQTYFRSNLKHKKLKIAA